MPKVLLDTTAYVDLERIPKQLHKPWAVNTMRHAAAYALEHGRPYLSTLTPIEIARGYEQELNPAKLQIFNRDIVPTFQIIGFDLQAACLAGEIYAKLERTRQRIGIPDTSIAAIAPQEGFSVVTSNTGHFQRIVNLGYPLQLENWREA